MSLFGSLCTAVSGLGAQSQATSIISNNIANVNTTGFKRAEASFAALVTVESASAKYSPGAVRVNRLQQIDQQGQIAQTGSSLDVAIAGDGFFTVRSEPTLDLEGDFKFTRNGQFFENENGILQNSAGMYLYGWPVDPLDQDPTTTQNVTIYNPDVSALVPVDVSLASGQSRVTTEATLGLNLDADEDAVFVDPLTNLIAFPATPGNNADYSRTIRMYDSLGSAQDVTFQYTKIYGPQAATTSSLANLQLDDELVNDLGLVVGDEFSLDVGGVNATFGPITATDTVNDIVNFVNNLGGGGVAESYLNGNGELVISAIDFALGQDITLANVTGTPLTTLGLTTVPVVALGTLPPDNLNGTFPDINNVPGSAAYNSRGWWQVNVVGPNPAAPLTQGLINFNSDGTLNALVDANGNRDIELVAIDWMNGSELQSININIDGHTQFAGLYNVSVASQDGADLGLKTGLEIDREGYVNARFSNGTLSRLYKLPIVTFPSSTHLQEISATAYVESAESGEPLLQEAGVSQAGFLETTSIEQSNVDLADEFTKLIVTQRAYSANTKVINTVDQMTEDLLRLR